MLYVDENDSPIENPDLTKGYLIDYKKIKHEEIQQEGHFIYEDLPGGGILQKYVIDQEYFPEWEEVTVQKYIKYTEEELEQIINMNYNVRISKLEDKFDQSEKAYLEGVQSA